MTMSVVRAIRWRISTPFPVAALRELASCFPETALWNFYGPTETFFDQSWKLPQIEEVDFAAYGK